MTKRARREFWILWCQVNDLVREGVIAPLEFLMLDEGKRRERKSLLVDQDKPTERKMLLREAFLLYKKAFEAAQASHSTDGQRVQAEALVRRAHLWRYPASVREGVADSNYDPMADYQRAESLYRLLSPHNLAVVCQQLGTRWEAKNKPADAVAYYRRAHDIWQELGKEHGRRGNLMRFEQYEVGCECARAWIDRLMGLVNEGVLAEDVKGASAEKVETPATASSPAAKPGPVASEMHAVKTPPDASGDPAVAQSSTKKSTTAKILIFPVYTEIAAGKGKLNPGLELEKDRFEIDELILAGESYRIEPVCKGDDPIRLGINDKVGVSRVEGNSMNLCNIQDGDYVLYWFKEPIAGEEVLNQIVVASFESGGQWVNVVKRLIKHDARLHLISESTEFFEPIEMHKVNARITGKVLAVLKRDTP